MLNPEIQTRTDTLAARFAQRDPFRHVVIEDFFAAQAARALLAEFPPFERGNARNEAGELGNKSSVEMIREIGPHYAALDDLIQTDEFLALIGRITGIPGLRYDPWYFGGGTHENRSGQDLDAHIDFNKHPMEPWHRRLNLIVYLNPEWDAAWGGVLSLHSDPRSPDDRIVEIAPTFNRAVIFETTEWSWHAFDLIRTPPDRPGMTRRSIALYFYTSERPAEELAPTHSTIYVDRPLPKRFQAGRQLDETDLHELAILLARRDQHNQRLYRDITSLTAQLENAMSVELPAPASTPLPVHSEQPLSLRFQPGHTLDESDAQGFATLLTEHDDHIRRLHRDVMNLSSRLASAEKALKAGRLGRLMWLMQKVHKRVFG